MARSRKPRSYAERNAASLAKHGKTLYQRRIESAERRRPGITRQAARGKPAAEHVARRERIQRRFGIPESELSDLRRRARAHIEAELEGVADRRPSPRKIARGVADMPLAMLYQVLEMTGYALREWASIQTAEEAEQLAGGYAEMGAENEFADLLAQVMGEKEDNPLWYHP